MMEDVAKSYQIGNMEEARNGSFFLNAVFYSLTCFECSRKISNFQSCFKFFKKYGQIVQIMWKKKVNQRRAFWRKELESNILGEFVFQYLKEQVISHAI